MGDRNGEWSTSTVLMSMFLGFTLGFLACHELYAGLEKKDFGIQEKSLTNLSK